MLISEFCKECFKSKFGTEDSMCPAALHPEGCRYGRYCWEEPTELTEDVKEELLRNYNLPNEDFWKAEDNEEIARNCINAREIKEEITNPIQCNLC